MWQPDCPSLQRYTMCAIWCTISLSLMFLWWGLTISPAVATGMMLSQWHSRAFWGRCASASSCLLGDARPWTLCRNPRQGWNSLTVLGAIYRAQGSAYFRLSSKFCNSWQNAWVYVTIAEPMPTFWLLPEFLAILIFSREFKSCQSAHLQLKMLCCCERRMKPRVIKSVLSSTGLHIALWNTLGSRFISGDIVPRALWDGLLVQSYTQFCPCYTFSPPSLYHILGCHKEDSQLLFFPVIATGLILRLWSSLCYFCHRVFNTYIFFPTSIHLYSHTNNGGLVLLSHLYLQIFDEKGSRVCMKQKKGISNSVHGRNAFTNLIICP